MDTQDTTPSRRKPRWERAFLAALRQTGNVCRACAVAKIDRGAVYDARRNCPDFAAAWEIALEEAAEFLELEARRRAYEGLVRYKFTRSGEPILHPVTKEPYYELEYSDSLLLQLLRGALPGKYRDNVKVEQSGAVQQLHSGEVSHDHKHGIAPEAMRAFAQDLLAAGLAHLPEDGGTESVDTAPPVAETTEVPPA